jgi:hypothetical protein
VPSGWVDIPRSIDEFDWSNAIPGWVEDPVTGMFSPDDNGVVVLLAALPRFFVFLFFDDFF